MIRNLIAIIFLSFVVLSCSSSTSGLNSDAANAANSSSQFEKTLLTITTSSGIKSFTVEIADTPSKRSQGLMFRNELGEDEGMIFVFPEAGSHSFFMRNTYVSLDMLFVDSAGQIIFIEENTTPLSEDVISPASPVLYVLEILAGQSDALGISVGDTVTFDH